jgi:photosystem II stability/assembly factor-like uncharacterized protein
MINRINRSVFLGFILLNSFIFSQNNNQFFLENDKQDKESNFYDIQTSFNEYENLKNVKRGYYVENGVKTKSPGWKLFKRWEWFWEQRIDISTGEFPNTNSAIEYAKINDGLRKTSLMNENWVNLGTNNSEGGYAGIGRINCIAFHPSDNNTFWVGSPSGGIWKTTNMGNDWTILNNNEAVLGVSDIAVNNDYSISNTLYIATGDRDGGSMWSLGGGQAADNVSIGILKSTDGGSTWNQTGLIFNQSTGAKVYRLLIHPSDNNMLIASTTAGIYKTIDGGENWTNVNPNRISDMEFKPGNPNIVYGTTTGYSNVYLAKSTNAGDSFSFTIPGESNGGYRGELAVSADNSEVVYIIAANNSGGLTDVFKSTNSGVDFTALGANSKSMLGYYSNGGGSNIGQGTYDLCIVVSPSDANTVYIGGINTWKSTDGGVTWAINNMWTNSIFYNFDNAPEVHADKHALAFQNGTTLFEGNDGGVYRTTNGGASWTDLSNGLVISQLYRIGVSQTNASTVLTGLQDNGSKLFNGGFWTDVKGGDGMECIVDYSNPKYMYATYVQGQISRSGNGGLSFPYDISAKIPGGKPVGAWVTPYIIDPINSLTLYAGYDKIWKTTDRGSNWQTASQVLSPSQKLRSLAIAPTNNNVIYTADHTNMWKTTDGGATDWSTISLPVEVTNSLTYIAVHASDPNIVWITFGGYSQGLKVYESTNGGSSWTNISEGLPNIPVMCIVQNKSVTDKNNLFVGTDNGVYTKDGINNWVEYSSGLPNAVVTELEIFYDTEGGPDKLIAGTYGRGLWETEILSPLPVELISFVGNVESGKILLQWQTATETENYGFEIQRSTFASDMSIGNWENLGFVNGYGNSNSPKTYVYTDVNLYGGRKYYYRLKQIDNDGSSTFSKIIEVNAPQVSSFSLNQNFPNPFNPATRIKYAIPTESSVKLIVTDLLGQEVDVILDETKTAGSYEVFWNPSNISSGIYFYTLSVSSNNNSQNFTETKKMVYLE